MCLRINRIRPSNRRWGGPPGILRVPEHIGRAGIKRNEEFPDGVGVHTSPKNVAGLGVRCAINEDSACVITNSASDKRTSDPKAGHEMLRQYGGPLFSGRGLIHPRSDGMGVGPGPGPGSEVGLPR